MHTTYIHTHPMHGRMPRVIGPAGHEVAKVNHQRPRSWHHINPAIGTQYLQAYIFIDDDQTIIMLMMIKSITIMIYYYNCNYYHSSYSNYSYTTTSYTWHLVGIQHRYDAIIGVFPESNLLR